jgi:homogentisate 1,2-dioxygenase
VSSIVAELDKWLAQLFDPESVDATIAAMVNTRARMHATEARAEAARRKLTDCDDRLGKYRPALDSGADPALVANG